MNKRLHFFLVPFTLTLLTGFIEPTCTQGLCLFPGGGIPLGYYYQGSFRINPFLVDLMFFFVLYVVPVVVVQDIKRWISRRARKEVARETEDENKRSL